MTMRVWTRAGVLELLANVALIATVPLIARLLAPAVEGLARSLGLGYLFDILAGNGGFTDIGLDVAGARGLVDPVYTAYDSSLALNNLIGMGGFDMGPHTHPPTSMIIWLPLILADYRWWTSFFAVASICAIALSMRVMKVPVWLAYPVALAIALSSAGYFSTLSTYPLSALALALVWTYRTHPVIAGPGYAFLIASRGIAALILLYPLAKRQWRTLLLATALVLGLLLVAVALEPTVVREFLTTGKDAVDQNILRPDSLTPQALATRRGLPSGLVWITAAMVAGWAYWRRRDLFWPVVWFSFAVTPIAWAHASVAALPLLVVVWRSGRLGQGLTLAIGFAALVLLPVAPGLVNAGWTVMVIATGIAIIACPLEAEDAPPPQTVIPSLRMGTTVSPE